MSKKDLLSYGTNNADIKIKTNRHIVCISGGLASAVVARWVVENIKEEVILYFNDVKWEHPDLYRFLKDVSEFLKTDIYFHIDGRTPEKVFYDNKMLGSNRTPLCSKILKAEMLQEFVNNGDIVYFGIGLDELHRASRITPIYERLGCKTIFPLIDNNITTGMIYKIVTKQMNIALPQMYLDGFKHNNCHGGCVRAGKKQWKLLLEKYPDVYADRERVEEEFNVWNNKRRSDKDPDYMFRLYSFMKDITLKEFRILTHKQPNLNFLEEEWQGECIGICGSMS